MKKGVFSAIIVLLMIIFITTSGGCSMFKKYENLEKYSRNTAGDMRGSSSSVYVSRMNGGQALLGFTGKDWYADDNTVREYLVPDTIITELEEVFKSEGMKRWNNKKITNVFVADGATTGYSFDFEKESVSFSSQYYPDAYQNKLNKLDEIIKKYAEGAELLPGLVVTPKSEEEAAAVSHPQDGLTRLEVYEYSENRLYYRYSNGTDEELKLPSNLCLEKADTGEKLYEQNLSYTSTWCAHSSEEFSFNLDERLGAGIYRLVSENLTCEFEIR